MKSKFSKNVFDKKRAVNLFAIISWCVLFVGLAFTGWVVYDTQKDIEWREFNRFEMQCEEIKLKIEARLATNKQMLLSAAAMFDSSNEVTRIEWKNYVNRLKMDDIFEGIQALGFSLWIKPEQLIAHENAMRKEGFTDYHVKPEGQRDAYTSIIYIEPFADRNLRAFGYDMYSEPVRHAAMQRAIDNNSVTLSGRVTLLQETTTDVQAGTLMYIPVYKKNRPIATVDERRAALWGLIYSPYRMSNLLNNMIPVADKDKIHLHLHVYGSQDIKPENLLFQSENHQSLDVPIFHLTKQIERYGIVWILEFEEFEGAQEKIDVSKVWIVLVTGSFISFLLFFLLRLHFMMRQNAHEIALVLTKKLTMSKADLFQFTNIAAHHLQEPTRRMVIFVQRLKNELENVIPHHKNITILLNFIEQSAIHQRALVRDIQIYLAATQARSAIELIDVESVLRKILDQNAVLISHLKAQVEYNKLPYVLIDRARLYDILNALLNNALCYRQENSPPKIRIYAESEGARIRYYVEDNGIGIPVEYRERVFLVFERLQVNENQDSTGIGLSVVKRIVESCGGTVSLKETAGGGTTVIFDLPTEI